MTRPGNTNGALDRVDRGGRSRLSGSATRWTVHLALALGLLLPGHALEASSAAPDLRLDWLVDGRPSTSVAPLRGAVGEVVRIDYRLRNVGGRDAFAVVLSAHTALGPRGAAERLEPGPARGGGVDRGFDLPLAEGMRELCIEARLQNRAADDPPDPNPRDNRICRRIEVEEPASTTSPEAHP